MPLPKAELERLLVDSDFLTKAQLEQAREEAAEREVPLEQVLVDQALMSDEEIGRLLADAYGVRFVDLRKVEVDPQAIAGIPEIIAKKHYVISFGWSDQRRQIAMVDPKDLALITLLQKKFGEELQISYTTPAILIEALAAYSTGIRKQVLDLAEAIKEKSEAAGGQMEVEDVVVRLAQLLLEYGYDNNASDIHVEPHERQSLVRYRLDGLLHDVFELPKELHDFLVARVKILSNLRTDEHFAAQDGKFRARFGNDRVDIRVSIVPIVEGEKIVMRLLSEKGRAFTLERLGLSKDNLKKLKVAADKPYGMLLATGPTGSGKTTTMYAVLKILNQRDVNIATIEDPVEYDVEGVNQIQVNPRTNLTFASGLRSIVRQDPDIIMVGEIRDAETADIAINAAMTGHLVLSTLHTNDAATALPRLLDMEVEPFLIASSVNIIIAQRLVRKVCKSCIVSTELDLKKFQEAIVPELYQKYFGKKLKTRGFVGKGCPVCHQTGFTGRIGVFEVLEVTDTIRELITRRANAAELNHQAVAEGMITMMEDGIKKVLEGVTTLEEVLRVVR